jgi:hypothetical protein
MRVNMRRGIITMGLVAWAAGASSTAARAAPEQSTQREKPRLKLLAIRAASMNLFQTGGSFYTFYAAWTPELQINEKLTARLALGGGYTRSRAGLGSALFEGAALGGYAITDTIAAELGPSAQYYLNNGGLQWAGTLNGLYRFPNKLLWVVDHIFLGYSAVFIPTNLTHIARAGVGLSLF